MHTNYGLHSVGIKLQLQTLDWDKSCYIQKRRHDTHLYDIQHNDIQHNDTHQDI